MASSGSSSPRPPPSKSLDLDLTIVSAKHLKNVNWKNGPLKPYVVFWVDSDRRLATKSDDSGNTSPIWNERFTLTLPHSPHHSILNLEIFHSIPSDTPKPLVATLRLPLHHLTDLHSSFSIQKFPLTRPSGRPQGKILLKLGLLGATTNPNPNHFPFPSNADTYSGYYPGYCCDAPPHSPRPLIERHAGPVGGPSGPRIYSYDGKSMSGRTGLVGLVSEALGGLALDERLNYEEDKIPEWVENDDVAAHSDDNDFYLLPCTLNI